MSFSSTFRRARVAGLAATVATAGALVAPSPAEAGVLDSPTSLTVATATGSGSCTSTGTANASNPSTFAADGVPVEMTATTSQTWTKTGDPSDVTTVSGTTRNTITATQAGGALKTLDYTTSFESALSSTLGAAQTCSVQLQIGVTYQALFDLPSARTVTVDVTSKNTFGALVVQSTNSVAGAAQELSYFMHTHTTKELYLPAGTYVLQGQGNGIHQAPTPGVPSPPTKAGSVTAHVRFDEPGSARAAATGSGTKYLALDAGRSCADGSLTGTWKSKAGKGDNVTIKKAVFKVNGKKVRTVTKPEKGSKTTLKGLDPEKSAEVTVKIKLLAKGAGTVAVERSYRICT